MVAKMSPSNPIRIWTAGCSSGEEVYTLAMLILESASRLKRTLNVSIFATDVDADALSTARAGVYPASQVETQITPDRIARFFTKSENLYKVNKNVRDIVVFSQHDLTRNPPLSKIDLITCRNVMIYLATKHSKKQCRYFTML